MNGREEGRGLLSVCSIDLQVMYFVWFTFIANGFQKIVILCDIGFWFSIYWMRKFVVNVVV